MSEPNHLDRMLTDFFRSEMPAKWPTPPRSESPARIRIGSQPGNSIAASRYALAAGISALLIGGWLLAGRVAPAPDRNATFDNTTATRPGDLRLGK
jgi:hypothetical protein